MNSEQQQQRIMGYFIEEAREHLQTIEQGVLNLQDILDDPESVNELFRAAHSIKGGAAMLGVGSIQHVSHRLEDFFKILKENPQINVDERLKSLLLAGFDPLSELLDELQVGFKISDELTAETSNRVKPVFAELESYLHQLVADANGKAPVLHLQPEAALAPPQQPAIPLESAFQQDVTTKMRDMLQLFRGEDTVESRSQLQTICTYFQDLGDNFNLRNWTYLATQIKNAIAQHNNDFRTLAPILIRELREAQDLVLTNREAEITVSAQIQSLLPYRFSEPEDDEVSTIFTTASGDLADLTEEASFVEDLAIANLEVDAAVEPDLETVTEDIDLFADSINEEGFDLAEIPENQLAQIDWMDQGYDVDITEGQHIDGPKVGSSELKSLAILFENDDIDFDAAWEDIESNETQILNHGAVPTVPVNDEFADLLDDHTSSVNIESGIPSLGTDQQSSLKHLFGDFATDTITNVENSDPLFPEELNASWQQDEMDLAQSNLDDLVTDDFGTDNSLDNQFDLNIDDLGVDIIDQINEPQIDNLGIDLISNINEPQVDDHTQTSDISIDNFSIDDLDFSDSSDNLAAISESDQFLESGFVDSQNHDNDQDNSESLSSGEYFAEIERQENELARSGGSEPFALTFSESDMGLLEDPFAIDENFDEFLLGISSDNTLDNINNEVANSDIDSLSEDAVSDSFADSLSSSESFDSLNTANLNMFDELGFDSDESTGTPSHISSDENFDNLLISDHSIDNSSFDANNLDFDDNSSSSVTDTLSSEFGDFTDSNEVDNADKLGDFFGESEGFPNEDNSSNMNIDEDIHLLSNDDELGDFLTDSAQPNLAVTDAKHELDVFDNQVDSTDELGDFFASAEVATISDEVNSFVSEEVSDVDGLDDFFAESLESENSSEAPNVTSIDKLVDDFGNMDSSDELGDFFAGAEDYEDSSSELDRELAEPNDTSNIDDLGNFFSEVDAPQGLNGNITDNDWDELGADLIGSEQSNQTDVINTDDSYVDAFMDFESDQDVDSNFLVVEDNIAEVNTEGNISEQFLDQATSSDDSDLANLFTNADENDLTILENDFNFEEDQRSLTQDANDINGLADILDNDFQDAASETSEGNLALMQEDDFGEDDITAKTTIDNLADFFQGDDDSEISSLKTSDDLESIEVNSNIEFAEFNEFADFGSDRGETSDISTANFATTMEDHQRSQPQELNGIDDDFNFDDLESMIGDSSNINESNDQSVDQSVNSQASAFVSNEQPSAQSDDMNFDELEALLGNSFDGASNSKSGGGNNLDNITAVSKPASKPNDDFDDLENLLQEKYSQEIGTLKTKTSVRPPTTTRKSKFTDSTMRVDVKYLDSLNNLVGELVVNRNLLEQDQERLQQFITNLLHQVQLLSDVSQRMRDQYDRSLLEASLSAGRGRSYTSSFDASYSSGEGGGSNNSVTNDFEGIEFDRYNTFHVLSQEIIELIVRVRESASDIEFVVGETDQVTRQLGTITTQVQDDLKQSRMVPFAQIADRLPRGIRDRALKTGKQADLEIFGRETLIDKAILESLTDPLTHLVNNAIDHGLEDPATRQAAGKSATGKLTVRAYHQGNQTVISISDDGAGISTDKVKKSAVSKGVRSQAEVDRLNDTEVYALLFEPGFSTAAQADEFKGRGVGLDVVKTCLDDIRGVIIVESVVGKGTTFTIRLPLTLSISKAMFCISDRARIAFPVDGFEDMVEVPQSQIMLNDKGQPCLPWRDTLLPFQHLSNLLSYSRHLSRSSIYGKQENDELCIIILRNDTSYLALQVDQFLGEYEIVIKQLEGPIPQPAGIAGATVLGDGRVMAIANVLELFDIASGRLRPSTSGATIQPTIEEEVAADPTVLIVDDSITVRELLSLTFAKVGYRVEQAKDGQDAWEKLRAGLPCDMIFCDIEMPRMDGLDLLSRLQKDSRLKEIPVAMLTSRGADRHRQSAIQLGAKGYFTKPYLEEELLSASKRLLAGETLPI